VAFSKEKWLFCNLSYPSGPSMSDESHSSLSTEARNRQDDEGERHLLPDGWHGL
jgi:hypothetical protein